MANRLWIAAALLLLVPGTIGAAQSGGQGTATAEEQIAIPLVPIALEPGWNLISIPFQPLDTAIDAIATPGHPADVVMTYDSASEAWAVSQRDPDTGLFAGDISEMTPDRAYFVRTDSFLPLLVGRPPLTTWSTPPAAPVALEVSEGWNLVPVIALNYRIPYAVAAEDYLRSLSTSARPGWLRALGYNPLAQRWEAISPGDVTLAGVGATNPCTGGPVYKARVEAGTEPCQAGPYIERSPAGSTTPGDVWGEFDGRDRVALRAALRMGKGYWVYASADGVILP
ncbi:MAG: hypothetical protein OXN15_01160 [Chloroflexota bacterium]|nr:hypothetical protein [Chloroflexota bacterium]MDE2969529.1 hypothetical protein [Chloroflexota bacterium]